MNAKPNPEKKTHSCRESVYLSFMFSVDGGVVFVFAKPRSLKRPDSKKSCLSFWKKRGTGFQSYKLRHLIQYLDRNHCNICVPKTLQQIYFSTTYNTNSDSTCLDWPVSWFHKGFHKRDQKFINLILISQHQ